MRKEPESALDDLEPAHKTVKKLSTVIRGLSLVVPF